MNASAALAFENLTVHADGWGNIRFAEGYPECWKRFREQTAIVHEGMDHMDCRRTKGERRHVLGAAVLILVRDLVRCFCPSDRTSFDVLFVFLR